MKPSTSHPQHPPQTYTSVIAGRARHYASKFIQDLAYYRQTFDNITCKNQDERDIFLYFFEQHKQELMNQYQRYNDHLQVLFDVCIKTSKQHPAWNKFKYYQDSGRVQSMLQKFIKTFSGIYPALLKLNAVEIQEMQQLITSYIEVGLNKNSVLSAHKRSAVEMEDETSQSSPEIEINPQTQNTLDMPSEKEPPAKKSRLEIPSFEDLLLETPFQLDHQKNRLK